MNVVERVRQAHGSLTATEQQAAHFITAHLTDVLIYNSLELSHLSGVSQPTLSRLYRKLGYASAAEFKQDVRRYHQPGAPEIAATATTPKDPAQDQLLRDVESLTNTYAGITARQLGSISHGILGARRVCVIGYRNNYPLALHLREQLVQSRDDVTVCPLPGQSIAEELASLTPHDYAVVFAARRRMRVLPRIVSSLRDHDVPTLMIGDSTVRRTAQSAAAQFIQIDLNSRILSSYTAAFSVIALIADSVASLAQSRVAATNQTESRIEDINRRFKELDELDDAQ